MKRQQRRTPIKCGILQPYRPLHIFSQLFLNKIKIKQTYANILVTFCRVTLYNFLFNKTIRSC